MQERGGGEEQKQQRPQEQQHVQPGKQMHIGFRARTELYVRSYVRPTHS